MLENKKAIELAVVQLCQTAAKYIHEKRGSTAIFSFEQKEVNSLVTEIDLWTEEFLVKGLREIVPEATILAEEGYSEEQIKGLQWIIDPIDGTTNMVYHIPPYSMSIALVFNGEPLIGVVYELFSNKCYHGSKGNGAYEDGIRIHTHNCTSISEAIIATGFPYSIEPKPDDYLALINHFVKSARGVRRHGAASVDLAYLAAGKFSGYYEINLNPWDVAAGMLLVREAGGAIDSFQYHNNDPLSGKSIIAAVDNSFLTTLKSEIDSIYQ